MKNRINSAPAVEWLMRLYRSDYSYPIEDSSILSEVKHTNYSTGCEWVLADIFTCRCQERLLSITIPNSCSCFALFIVCPCKATSRSLCASVRRESLWLDVISMTSVFYMLITIPFSSHHLWVFQLLCFTMSIFLLLTLMVASSANKAYFPLNSLAANHKCK